VGAAARRGTTVVWATQRIDEIRGFAGRVTVLRRGTVRFDGSVAELLARAPAQRYLVELRNGRPPDAALERTLADLLAGRASIRAVGGADADAGHYVLGLAEGTVLGDALAVLTRAEIQVLSCREERSGVEEAFLSLMEDPA
jgi:ABC-type multidrug transport system ATPase subunit